MDQSGARLATRIGGLAVRNPVICAAGEHVMTLAGVRAALAQGVGGVVAKSVSESGAAVRQMDGADYARLDTAHRRIAWADVAGPTSLFNRSGMADQAPPDWFAALAALDREAAAHGQFVAGSVVMADPDAAVALAAEASAAGLRVFELNMGAPHASEAAPGAITNETDPARVAAITRATRAAFSGQLWIKLTGMGGDLPALARAAHDAGADAVGLMGRFLGLVPDLDTMRPLLDTSAGYGGGWALPITCRNLALARQATGPDRALIGTNGARGGLDVARMLLAGASAVEMCSVVIEQGFGALGRAIADLDTWLETRSEKAPTIVGRAADALQSYADQPSRPGHWRTFVPAETLGE